MSIGYLTNHPNQTYYQNIVYKVTATAPRILAMLAIGLATIALVTLLAKAGSVAGTTANVSSRFTQECLSITVYSGLAGFSLLGICLIRDVTAGVFVGIAERNAKEGLKIFCEELEATFSLCCLGCKAGCSK